MKRVTSKPHILIVEDNPGDLFILQEALSELKFNPEISIARDGQQAIEMIIDEGLNPTILLLDINLPRKSGFEVIVAIKQSSKSMQIPIIIFTTSSSPEDIKKAYALGASSYLCKASDIDETIDIMTKMKEFYLDTAMLPAFS